MKICRNDGGPLLGRRPNLDALRRRMRPQGDLSASGTRKPRMNRSTIPILKGSTMLNKKICLPVTSFFLIALGGFLVHLRIHSPSTPPSTGCRLSSGSSVSLSCRCYSAAPTPFFGRTGSMSWRSLSARWACSLLDSYLGRSDDPPDRRAAIHAGRHPDPLVPDSAGPHHLASMDPG